MRGVHTSADMGSDESARSHGLSMLEGRGFKLGSANEWSHLRRASSDSLPPAPSAFPSPFERQPSRTRGLEYRQLLIQRALMEADTDRVRPFPRRFEVDCHNKRPM